MANLPKIALGAWAWGNDGTFGNNLTAESLKPIFDTAIENGLNLWDTAYAYGMGTSEKVLAGFLEGLPRESSLAWLLTKVTSPVVGATKLHHIEGAAKAVDLELTDEELTYLEELYVPHPLAGVMAQNKRTDASKKEADAR